jgi:hypothetical protein
MNDSTNATPATASPAETPAAAAPVVDTKAARRTKPSPAKDDVSPAVRAARRAAKQVHDQVSAPEVRAIHAELKAQSQDAANHDPTRRVARREFDSQGNPAANPKTRARAAR